MRFAEVSEKHLGRPEYIQGRWSERYSFLWNLRANKGGYPLSKRETRKQKTANSKAAGRRKSHSRRSPGQKEIWPINRTDYSNPNMPVRCFLYAAHALEKYLNDTKKARFQALGSYESYLEDNLPDLHFYADITARFEEINGLYRKYDDCCISFDDLLAELNTANPKEIIKLELIGISFWFFCSTGIISADWIHPHLTLLRHRDYF